MDGIFGKRFLWPFSLCPLAWKCNHTVAQLRKYLHKFWFKSLQWFRSYLSSHDYYGLVLGLQKNFQTRSGITEASIEFLRSIVTRALLIARKAAEDPWLRWQTMWLKLNSFVSHKTINQELTKASVKQHWRVTEMDTVNAEQTSPPSIQENANISSKCQYQTVARLEARHCTGASQWLL